MQRKDDKKEPASLKPAWVVYAIWFLKNIFLLTIAYIVVNLAFSKQPAYNWVYNQLLKENMKLIRSYPDLSYDQKMQMKLGASYEYLLFLKQTTPEDAIILYPNPKAFKKEGSPFTQEIFNKIYATRFLYPRKLVLENEIEQSKYADKITHVAIVNGEGKDKLPYPIDSTFQHGVLPLKPQK